LVEVESSAHEPAKPEYVPVVSVRCQKCQWQDPTDFSVIYSYLICQLGDGQFFGCQSIQPGICFGYRHGIIVLDAEIAHRALNLGVAEKQLDRPWIPGFSIDRCHFGSP